MFRGSDIKDLQVFEAPPSFLSEPTQKPMQQPKAVVKPAVKPAVEPAVNAVMLYL